jgi:two-component system, chemotaxis family, response regulator Rcp1
MRITEHQPARIVVVEDSPADILLLRHALDEHGDDYEIEVLRDGAEALQFVGEQRANLRVRRPCVIVLDLHLPKHDGLTVLAAIKKEPALEHLHVVALSSFASPHDEAEIYALGARRYCEKPLDLDGWLKLAGDILALCREPATSAVFSPEHSR